MSLLRLDRDALHTPTPTSGGRSPSAAEYASLAFEHAQLADQAFGVEQEMNRRYEGLVQTLNERTGESLKFVPATTPSPFSMVDPKAIDVRGFWRRVAELREANPELLEGIPSSHESIYNDIRAHAQVLEGQSQDFAERADGLASLAGLAGSMGGVTTDPVVLASMLFGAPVRLGFMAKVAAESGIAMATETAIQPLVQSNREELGLPSGLSQAVTNILTAGVGAGALTATLLGVRKALPEFKPGSRARRKIEHALRDLEDMDLAIRDNPMARPASSGHTDHANMLDEAILALDEGRLVDVRGVPADELSARAMALPELRRRIVPALNDIGLDLTDVMPRLGGFIETAGSISELALSRARIEALEARLTKATTPIVRRLTAIEKSMEAAVAEKVEIESPLPDIREALAGSPQAMRRVLSDRWKSDIETYEKSLSGGERFPALEANIQRALKRRRASIYGKVEAINQVRDALTLRRARILDQELPPTQRNQAEVQDAQQRILGHLAQGGEVRRAAAKEPGTTIKPDEAKAARSGEAAEDASYESVQIPGDLEHAREIVEAGSVPTTFRMGDEVVTGEQAMQELDELATGIEELKLCIAGGGNAGAA